MLYVFALRNSPRKFFSYIVNFMQIMWHPPNLDKLLKIKENQDLVMAYNWAVQFAPSRNGSVYDAVLKYAESYHKEVIETSDAIDKNSDELMRISGTVAAALAAAGHIESLQAAYGSVFIVVAIIRLVLSMLICASARRPVRKAVPMTIKAAMEVAELSGLPKIPNEDEELVETDQKDFSNLWSPAVIVTPTTAQVNATIAASYHWAVTGT